MALAPPLIRTPPMGFNNWARFGCNLNETLFVNTAKAMRVNGMLAAGYNQLNLDDCWMERTRGANGSLVWNSTLFPSGIPNLVETVKKEGFQLGIYANAGNQTCEKYPGSAGYEEIDVKTFSSWGINYVKVDGCFVTENNGTAMERDYQHAYNAWHEAISKLAKPLIFSESAPAYFSNLADFKHMDSMSYWYTVMEWVSTYGQLARHSTDINVNWWDYKPSEFWPSIMVNYGAEILLARYQKIGFYNDPDFITPDSPLTLDEKKSHFALWSSFSAPLIISAYIPGLSAEQIKYLTNKDIIAVDQDPLGLQATLVSRDETWDVLTKDLYGGDRLLTILNRSDKKASTSVSVERIGLIGEGSVYSAKDLWDGTMISVNGSISVTLPSHATAIFRFFNVSTTTPTGMIFHSKTMDCLTATNSTVTLAKCNGSDSQVWKYLTYAQFSPLSAPKSCLTSNQEEAILKDCDNKDPFQYWHYHITGNVINGGSGKCLNREAAQGISNATVQASIKTCVHRSDAQDFALPSGIDPMGPPKIFNGT